MTRGDIGTDRPLCGQSNSHGGRPGRWIRSSTALCPSRAPSTLEIEQGPCHELWGPTYVAPGSFSSPPVPQTHQPLSHWAPALECHTLTLGSGPSSWKVSPDTRLTRSFQTAPSWRSPSMTNHTVIHPHCSPGPYLFFFPAPLTIWPALCISLLTVCHTEDELPRQEGAQSLPHPLPVSSTGARPALSREVLSPLPSPAQGTGQDWAGRCSVPSRLQRRGQACTQQGGAQSLPTAPISSIEVRPALGREVLSPLPSPAQRSGLHSANGEQMHHQHWRDRHTGCWARCLQKGVLGPDSKKHWLMTCWWTLKGKKVPPVNRV